MSRGRNETRACRVIPIPENFPGAEGWKKLAQIVRYDSQRITDGTTTRGTRWLITSRKTLTAKQALAAVRGHWQVENKLHWSPDVAFRDDDARLRAVNAAENFAVVPHVALDLLRNVVSEVGIKNRRLKARRRDDFLQQVLVSDGRLDAAVGGAQLIRVRLFRVVLDGFRSLDRRQAWA